MTLIPHVKYMAHEQCTSYNGFVTLTVLMRTKQSSPVKLRRCRLSCWCNKHFNYRTHLPSIRFSWEAKIIFKWLQHWSPSLPIVTPKSQLSLATCYRIEERHISKASDIIFHFAVSLSRYTISSHPCNFVTLIYTLKIKHRFPFIHRY